MKSILPSILILTLFVNCQQASTQQPNIDKKGLAIQGYDPVSYFNSDEPLKGNKSIRTAIEGRIYQFSSEKNKITFLENPSKFEPVYGGWCAYAIGLDASKVKINPNTFKIIDDKLYLFYDFFGIDTLEKWNENEPDFKSKADKNWKNLK